MPIEVGIWRIGEQLTRMEFRKLESEAKLEEIIAADLSLVAPGLMLIGRQVATAFGKYIDILAMDRDGNLVVIELKRDKTPREVIAQTLDYASWVEGLSYDDISKIYAEKNSGQNFEAGYSEAFERYRARFAEKYRDELVPYKHDPRRFLPAMFDTKAQVERFCRELPAFRRGARGGILI